MADLPALRWSMIGRLQTNKAKEVARFASEFQALDRLCVAETLNRRLVREDRTLDVLVQVNTSNEPSKFGLAPDNVADFVRELPAFPRLRVQGLMTLAVFSQDSDKVRPCFVRLRDQVPEGIAMETLSMGMSGDFELAIEEGATVVRVGQADFRPAPATRQLLLVGCGAGRRLERLLVITQAALGYCERSSVSWRHYSLYYSQHPKSGCQRSEAISVFLTVPPHVRHRPVSGLALDRSV